MIREVKKEMAMRRGRKEEKGRGEKGRKEKLEKKKI